MLNGGQLDKGHARCGIGGGDLVCEFQRKPRLPRSARPGERDQADGGIGEPASQRLQLSVAAEDDCQSRGQRDAAQLLDRWIVIERPCTAYERLPTWTRQVKRRTQSAHRVDMGSP